MAIPVQSTTANTHVSQQFGELLEPGLRKIFFNYLKEVPEQYKEIYNVLNSNKAEEKDWGMGAFQGFTERTSELDEVAYEKLDPGLERLYRHTAFTDGFMIGRELYDDEMYRQIAKFPAALARVARVRVEKDAVSILINGFSTDADKAIYDGQPLFSASHPLISSASTGDNLLTGALNEANLKAAFIQIRQTIDEAGNPVVSMPTKLIVPPALQHTAEVLLGTKYKPGTDYNDINVLEGKLKLVIMDYLGANAGGSDTAWYIQCDSHEMNFFWRTKLEFKWKEEFDNFVAKYRGYMRYSYGVSDWRGIYGSTGL